MLILPGVDAEAAEDCAERARAALAELTVRGRPLAASAGVAASPGGRRRRRASCSRTATPRCTGPSARAAGGPSATCAGAVRPEARAARRDRGAARARHERAADRLPAGRRAGHGPPRRLRGAHALRSSTPPRAGRVVRAGAPRRARARSSRRSPCAPRSPSRAVPTAPSWRSTSRRARCCPRRCGRRCPQDLTGIVVELTEHELFGAEGELETELAALRARGARVALDDAGAGYAGLQQIIRDRARHPQARPRAGARRARRRLASGAAGGPDRLRGDDRRRGLRRGRRGPRRRAHAGRARRHLRPGLRPRPARVPPWPSPIAEATAAGAAEIRAGLRVSIAPRGVAGAFASGIARARRRARHRDHDRPTSGPRSCSAAAHPARRRRRADARRPCGGRARALSEHARQLARQHAGRSTTSPPPATCSTTASPARSSWATRPATRLSSPSSRRSAWRTLLIVPIVYGGRELAVLEIYRTLPQAFTAREVDRARVARPAVRRGAGPPHIAVIARATSAGCRRGSCSSAISGRQAVVDVSRSLAPRISKTSWARTLAGSTWWSTATPATSPSAASSSRAERETPEQTLKTPGSPCSASSPVGAHDVADVGEVAARVGAAGDDP